MTFGETAITTHEREVGIRNAHIQGKMKVGWLLTNYIAENVQPNLDRMRRIGQEIVPLKTGNWKQKGERRTKDLEDARNYQ